jgi:isopenicillin N synthase-like dioxygenase
MRPAFIEYFERTSDCAKRLLQAFAASLGQPHDFFTQSVAKPITRCSAVYYPPQPPDAGADQFGVAPHTDYGLLTLVHQDPVGGLQVRTRDGQWVLAHPIPTTLVVNVGDLLARWTNDRFKSTLHRVVNSSGRERLSLATFFDPDYQTLITPVVRDGEAARYQSVSCGEYILGRYDKSFAYRAKT